MRAQTGAVLERVAFIGAGAMGEALIRGLLRAGRVAADGMVAADKSPQRREHVASEYGVQVTDDNARAIAGCSMVVLAVKPQHLEQALEELAPAVRPGQHLVLSVAAGVPTRAIEARLPEGTAVLRAMPNTAAAVGESATALCRGRHATDEDEKKGIWLLEAIGRVVVVPEPLMDAVTGLSGSGPAYAFLVVEALTEGGVAAGLPREQALVLAAQTLLGAARLVLETGRHPAELRQQVMSPAGTTAAGLLALERAGVKAAFWEAVLAASRRSRELGEAAAQNQRPSPAERRQAG